MSIKRDPPLPFELGPVSNGECAPLPSTPMTREATRRTLAAAEEHARRLGMDRRHFLQGLGGAATMLLALGACSSEESASRGTVPGGTFSVPTTAPLEPDVAAEVLGGDEVVVDVQTHLLDYLGTGTEDVAGDLQASFALEFPQAECGRDDPRECFGIDVWIDEVLNHSDTSIAVLSALPLLADPHPLDMEVMERTSAAVAELCGTGRVLMQGQANPSVGPGALEAMVSLAGAHDLGAWKVYTHTGGPVWSLDDHDPQAAPVGRAFLDQVRTLGPPIVAVHKGLGDENWASPVDVGPAAVDYPDLTFVVYHSGWEPSQREGPYDPEAAARGIDRLVDTVVSNGLGPGGNVYAELGSTWFFLMRDLDQAAHALGKLLVHLGPDNIMWGTDSIWYGSPQEQIQMFRTFEITEAFQEQFGYPALTEDIRRKILGGNALRVYGVLPPEGLCRVSATEIDELRLAAGPPRTYGPRTIAQARELFASHTAIA